MRQREFQLQEVLLAQERKLHFAAADLTVLEPMGSHHLSAL